MTEKRKHRRFDLQLPVEIMRPEWEPQSIGQTLNVSSSGVLFATGEPLRVGESIEYLITFPRNPRSQAEVRLCCAGKVVRSQKAATFAVTIDHYDFVRTLRVEERQGLHASEAN